jgi:diguanylate cyclase (GGDEF)-like protein/PAS domain S-box-containing protein
MYVAGKDWSAVRRLVSSAAHAAGCEAAALYTLTGSELVQTSFFGPELTFPPRAEAWLIEQMLQADEGSIFVVNDISDEKALEGLVLQDQFVPRFLAVLPVYVTDQSDAGLLMIAGGSCRAGFSPAQDYVLITHALQLGRMMSEPVQTNEIVATQVKNARAERLRLLESVVVNANDAILITEAEPIDLPGPRIVYCNAAFSKTTGYAEADIIGLTPRILQSPHSDRQVLDRLRAALQKWEPVEVELLNVQKDGTEFWVELSIVPVADERGWYTHWVSVQRDVSQRRTNEEIATRARIAEVENRALEMEIQERKIVEEQLLFTAFHDDLTRLLNRAYLMDRLGKLIGLSRQNPAPSEHASIPLQCSLLFLDLDRFKLINDGLGHRAGDLLLMEVARRLRSSIRSGDTLARVGGDEFAVLIEGPDSAADAVEIAERIIDSLRRSVSLGKSEAFIACSVGIAHSSGQYSKAEELLRDADIAMYVAKKQGGNGHATFNSSMHAGAVDLLVLQTDLRHAIARSELFLDYQPIYNTNSGHLIAVEALVRWQHPDRGRLGPDVFIPIAQDVGMIREIDRWVMHEGCSQLRQWQMQYPATELRLSINVSGDELRDASFIDELRGVLDSMDISGQRLQIEITETVFLHRPDIIGRVLAEIRALGVRVALDDFGTGYSSLGYLDRYQIDTIKIDRSFVVRMLKQERAMAIMEAIVQLGSALKLEIVAEGVETEAQLLMLRSLGCSTVQGYLLGQPMNADAIARILYDQTASEWPFAKS